MLFEALLLAQCAGTPCEAGPTGLKVSKTEGFCQLCVDMGSAQVTERSHALTNIMRRSHCVDENRDSINYEIGMECASPQHVVGYRLSSRPRSAPLQFAIRNAIHVAATLTCLSQKVYEQICPPPYAREIRGWGRGPLAYRHRSPLASRQVSSNSSKRKTRHRECNGLDPDDHQTPLQTSTMIGCYLLCHLVAATAVLCDGRSLP